MHVAQIGTGRVGRPTAYSIMNSSIVDTLTVCDIKPGLAAAFAEELKHVNASTSLEIEICSQEKNENISNADIIIIAAGHPRIPGIRMSRRDLANENARIIKSISEATVSQNPSAKYIVISNPVDAMAMICKKYTKADFVISTGTNLESLRFRSKIAELLQVPISQVNGWVGGEHGDGALPLWSTTTINNTPFENHVTINTENRKREIETYVKQVSKSIVDNIGGTEFGPAASFRDITQAIIKKSYDLLSVSAPMKFEGIPEPTFIGLPRFIGETIDKTLYDSLLPQEKDGLFDAAKAIYSNYQNALEAIE